MISVHPDKRIIDWSKLLRCLPLAASHAIVFAAGGWLVSIRAQEGRLPYLTKAAHQVEQVKAITGLPPLAAIKCERKRADFAEVVASQALAIANFDALPKNLLSEIPDCPKDPGGK